MTGNRHTVRLGHHVTHGDSDIVALCQLVRSADEERRGATMREDGYIHTTVEDHTDPSHEEARLRNVNAVQSEQLRQAAQTIVELEAEAQARETRITVLHDDVGRLREALHGQGRNYLWLQREHQHLRERYCYLEHRAGLSWWQRWWESVAQWWEAVRNGGEHAV